MDFLLSDYQLKKQKKFRNFSEKYIKPYASECDRTGALDPFLVNKICESGYPGALVPKGYGGLGLDMTMLGILCCESGSYCSSMRSLLTVYFIVSDAINRWGTDEQKSKWLPELASGRCLPAFALTELDSGCDISHISTSIEPKGSAFCISGSKTWISFGEMAHLILLFGKIHGDDVAVLVEKNRPGVFVKPVSGRLLGARGSMLSTIEFNNVIVDRSSIIGRPKFGLSAVAAGSLDVGRYTIAWGSLGMARACLAEVIARSSSTVRFDEKLSQKSLVKRMLTKMIVDIQSVELLCFKAGQLKDASSEEAIRATYIAKYAATKLLTRVSRDTIQILGAKGCMEDSLGARAYRDARVFEVIEGPSELHEHIIADQTVVDNK